MDYSYLKLDGTEDDHDDDDYKIYTEQTAHPGRNKLDNWNVCGNLSSRKKSE